VEARVSALRVVTEDRRPFFTPKTLAEFLAISERSVWHLLTTRKIASYKVAGSRRVAAEDVDAYLAVHRDERA
jgi:excisionase family DNA binding protein